MGDKITVINRKSGTIHVGWKNAAIVHCSSGRSRFQLRELSEIEIKAAPDHRFCEKCFPSGHPNGKI